MPSTLFETSIKSLPLLGRGKVRDNYEVSGNRMLMVASDRLSAFDVVMSEPIPGKGELLTKMALFWFQRLSGIVPNHLTSDAPESVVLPSERPQVVGRSMLVRRLRPVPIEAVVRGYLAGSGWTEYRDTGLICANALPAGLMIGSKLPDPIFTPATKAPSGKHDENISFDEMKKQVGVGLSERIRETSMQLYRAAAEYALRRGIIIADTKFEFGLDQNDEIVLMDEVLTPDSSRYWPMDEYRVGVNPPSFDKQYVRDWLESVSVNGRPWNKRAPAPVLPDSIVAGTAKRYQEAFDRLTK